ncbi:MAG: threonine synthase [Actinomycetota bacterium]
MTSRLTHLECARCGATHDAQVLQQRCHCGGTLLARYHLSPMPLEDLRSHPSGMWRYWPLLPILGTPIELAEPMTPLLFAPRLSARWGQKVYVKDESPLPGGTFKARGAAVGLSRAVELGAKSLVMPSAGNAGGAWSLYAARAGIPITVTMARTAPAMNQAEVLAAGGDLELVEGTIADAGTRAKEIAEETGAFLAATFSEPYRLEGKKSAWLETFDALGDPWSMGLPATIVTPVGGGVAAIAALKGAEEAVAMGWAKGPPPRIVGVQSERCAPIVRAFERGETEVAPWDGDPTTIAAGLRVPAPSEGGLVLDRVRASKGTMVAVTEDEIVAAVRDLASTEGIFACPEGAATVAAADRLASVGELAGPVVLYNTGAGAKYADLLAAAGLTT